MRLLHDFQSVERVAHAPDLKRYENDVEHSYFLAMTAWYLVDSLKLDLDRSLVLQYALAHDLVEVYAGDTYAFDSEGQKTKHEREEKSRLQIESEFPEFTQLHERIAAYEQQSSPESVFVRTLDKLLPVITNYLQEGYTWREMSVTFEMFLENKRTKTAPHELIRELLEQIIIIFEPEKTRYFAETTS